jgi:hypothetical protein
MSRKHPPRGTTAYLELEEPSIPTQRLFEVADLERHVVDPDKPLRLA